MKKCEVVKIERTQPEDPKHRPYLPYINVKVTFKINGETFPFNPAWTGYHLLNSGDLEVLLNAPEGYDSWTQEEIDELVKQIKSA